MLNTQLYICMFQVCERVHRAFVLLNFSSKESKQTRNKICVSSEYVEENKSQISTLRIVGRKIDGIKTRFYKDF